MKHSDYTESRTHSTGSFPLAYYSYRIHGNPNETRFHCHKEYEIGRVLSDEAYFYIDNQWYHLQKNDIYIVSSGALHGLSRESRPNYDCECIVFLMEELIGCSYMKEHSQYDFSHFHCLPHFSSSETELQHLFDILIQLCRYNINEHEIFIVAALHGLIGWLYQNHCFSEQDNLNYHMEHVSAMKKVLDIMSQQYYQPLTLEKLSKYAGMSSNYFATCFTSFFHQSPISYLNDLRLENARIQLMDHNAEVTQVAFDVGYNSCSYFIRTFKKRYGITPKQFQLQNKHYVN